MILWPIWMMTFLFSAVLYILFFIIFPPEKLHPLVRLICMALLFSGGQGLKISGKAPDIQDGPFLYLFNHESMFDGFMLGAAINHYFTAVGAVEQFSYPVWGFLLRRYGVIPIKRKNLGEAIHSLDQAENAIKMGTSFIISPEGTRTLTGKMNPFKKGPFHLALNTGVTLVPVGLKGVFRAKKKTDWRLNPGILKLNFGRPITHNEYENLSLEKLQSLIRGEILRLSTQPS